MKVLTGHRLRDGIVVFWGQDGWVHEIARARCSRNADEEAAFEQIGRDGVANRDVVDVALIDVQEEAGIPVPVRLREKIRAYGPTIHGDFAKQAAQ